MKKPISAVPESGTAARQRLSGLRLALLDLHKALVDSERAGYERTFGAIPSPHHFFRLLLHDPWFAWLHPLSQLIVSLDEALDGRKPLSAAEVEGLVEQCARLLAPAENGQGYGRHYFEALQRDPDVVLAHARAVPFITRQKTRPQPSGEPPPTGRSES
jgi:hypothetical protein